MSRSSEEAELLGRIKVLSDDVWERRCREPDVERWLNNFDGTSADPAVERFHALHLLSHVSYFGLRELRVLLRALYRDHLRYPIMRQIRTANGGTRDSAVLEPQFQAELEATRFLGMGNPAESGTHLLYYFRQENDLRTGLFVQQHELLSGPVSDQATRIVPPDLKRIVFIDDLCGSGQQAVDYSQGVLQNLTLVAGRDGRTLDFQYFVLFGTQTGLERVHNETDFSTAVAVGELDDTYKTFGPDSRVFKKPPAGIDKAISRQMALTYGQKLWPAHPLGYSDRQLLLAFHYNVPDNTLPIIWRDEYQGWHPAFPRYHKVM